MPHALLFFSFATSASTKPVTALYELNSTYSTVQRTVIWSWVFSSYCSFIQYLRTHQLLVWVSGSGSVFLLLCLHPEHNCSLETFFLLYYFFIFTILPFSCLLSLFGFLFYSWSFTFCEIFFVWSYRILHSHLPSHLPSSISILFNNYPPLENSHLYY